MKQLLIFLNLYLVTLSGFAQSEVDLTYTFLQSGSYVQDKNFYVFTLFSELKEVRKLIQEDAQLKALLQTYISRNQIGFEKCQLEISCMIRPMLFSKEEQKRVQTALERLFETNQAIKKTLSHHLRASGCFIRHQSLDDKALLQAVLNDAFQGIQNIVDTYVLGKKGRYPKIDSLGYDPNSRYYQRVIRSVCFSVVNDFENMDLFFQPVLQLALTVLDINNRDEAGRHEPMTFGENEKALAYIPTIQWDKYKYACILQPGHGPEKEGIALSPFGKMRVKLVAERFHKGWAPLIILSGGYVHPFQTPFAEATEMKKVLINDFDIPERAIIIEPHARHTTTNFRNSARLMFRYGIPTEKMSVCTSTFDQIIYITDPAWKFDARNQNELGYLPYKLFEKVSRNDIEFKPVITSLHMDAKDPLDP